MRVFGRITNEDGSKSWIVVSTDPITGSSSWVYVTAFCQAMLLNLGESPFYAQFGIPAVQSVIQQIAPDFYVSRMVQYFAQFFASLIVARVPAAPVPTYNVNATLLEGTPASVTVQVPE
jgi:hypothetical protein